MGWSCLSVRPVDLIRESLDGFGLNSVLRFCHSARRQTQSFKFPTSGDSKMADEEIRGVDTEVLRSCR